MRARLSGSARMSSGKQLSVVYRIFSKMDERRGGHGTLVMFDVTEPMGGCMP